MMYKLKGLIPERQQPIIKAHPKWKFGDIINGKKYIDNILGLGCFMLGYERHDIIDFVCENLKFNVYENAENFFSLSNNKLKLHDCAIELSDTLYNITGGYKSFFALSGSDANEGAIKLAGAYHKLKGNYHKKKIVSFDNSYHGSTLLNQSIGNSTATHKFYNFNLYENIQIIDRKNEINQLEWNDVACIILETVSWANNFIPLSSSILNTLKYAQKEHDVLVIVDDILCCGGKSGNYIGWNKEQIQPNIFTMGKGMTGGYFPLSATLFDSQIDNVLPNNFIWDHGFTYSFSSPGILSTIKYLNILSEENLLQLYPEKNNLAKSIFNKCGYSVISQYGGINIIGNKRNNFLFIIPLNADEEYYEILEKFLIKN